VGPRETVVFDTDVLVSAVGRRGPEHELYERCRAGELRLAISPELLAELRRVLRYPKFGFEEEEIEGFVSDLLDHAVTVSPSQTVEVIEEDPEDNRVIECALAAGARWIVSGDKHLLGLEEYEGIRIVGAAAAKDPSGSE
jgi:putative PIN family toxin of toxin-antitoxin system